MSETPSKSQMSLSRIALMAMPFLIFVALAGIFFSQLISGKDTSELPSALINKPVPEFDLKPLEGLNHNGSAVPGVKSSDLKGSVTLVNIFASWCVPCRAEHPVLIKLAENEQLNIVGINYKDEGENARRFLGVLGNPYKRVGVDRNGRTAIEWGFYGIPETLLVDSQGIIRHKIVGPIDAKKFETLQQEIDKLL